MVTVLTSAADYRNLAIPVQVDSPRTRSYRHIPVNLSAPEAREELVELAPLGIAVESYYSRTDGFNSPYYGPLPSALPTVYCRETVARKLLQVNKRLRPYGTELFVWDGYRPLGCQRDIWDFSFSQARRARPNSSDEELIDFVSAYCSDPRAFKLDDSTTWPTHITGGAVDLTLRRLGKAELLFMGGTFDDPSITSHTAYFEQLAEPRRSASDIAALRNRRLLYWAMTEEGFANYSFEWWHFDWGTQMWILNRGATENTPAVYGPATPLDY